MKQNITEENPKPGHGVNMNARRTVEDNPRLNWTKILFLKLRQIRKYAHIVTNLISFIATVNSFRQP